KIGAYFVMPDGAIGRRLEDVMDKRKFEKVDLTSKAAVERIKGMVRVRDALRALMRAEMASADDSGLAALRAQLNRTYDDFVKKQGYINALGNRRAFQDDPDLPLLESLEPGYNPGISKDVAKKRGVEPQAPSAGKADIFTRRVLAPYTRVEHAASPKDALVASMNEHGGVNLDYMADITGTDPDTLVKELAGLVYQNPQSQQYEVADQYLTGNVKAKLAAARAAAATDARYKANVEALEKVQPIDVPAVDIAVRLGSTWVPAADVADFVKSILNVDSAVSYTKAIGLWNFRLNARPDHTTLNVTWGTARMPANEMIPALLNMRPIVVKDNIGTRAEPHYVVNQVETQAAQAKAADIMRKFKDWIWEDAKRRERLERVYNDTYNTDRPRVFDGSHLQLPGMSPAITLRPSQKNAIWRAIQDRVTLLDHVVGAGKTYTMVAIAMELRRLGVARKPMFTVPNYLVRQWRDEFYKLYPNANILATTEKDFEKGNRQRLFSRIATGDWDAVIVGHSSFKKVGMPAETEKAIVGEMVDELADAIETMKRERGDKNVLRDMERIKVNLESKVKKLAESGGRKDDVVSFDELGVDSILVDEAHLFKNLFYFTKMQRVSGLGNPAGSGRAFDLFVKTQFLDQRYGGRAPIVFATGTPVSNSLVEMFTMQRYLMYRELKDRGVHLLDAWARVFGDVQSVYEVHPSGNGYRLTDRFAKFVNMPELMALYRRAADIITIDDLKKQSRDMGQRFPVPNMKGGKPNLVVAERSPQQTEFFGVPQFKRDAEGNVLFKFMGNPSEYSVGKDAKTEKWAILQDGKPVSGGLADEAEARAELKAGLNTPLTEYNEGSILWKFENLRWLSKESNNKINALSITNEARKAGLDYRLIDPSAADFPDSKLNQMVTEAVRIYQSWQADRGTQLVFCDLSVPSTARAKALKEAQAAAQAAEAETLTEADNDKEEAEESTEAEAEQKFSMDQLLAAQSKFSVYDDVRGKLIAAGIPANEIAFIHDYDTAEKKGKLFQAVRDGRIRVLMGSTEKMGAGMNVQDRLVGIHHLDAPWRPSDLEQRNGRIIRQGNKLYERDPDGFQVEELRYATKQTYDTRMWQIIEHKARGVEQLRKASDTARVVDDVSGEAASAADMKAAASGNPLILDEIKLRNEVSSLEAQESNFLRNKFDLQRRADWLSKSDQRAAAKLGELQPWVNARDGSAGKDFSIDIGGKTFADKKSVSGPLVAKVAEAIKSPSEARVVAGTYRGVQFAFRLSGGGVAASVSINGEHWTWLADYDKGDEFSPNGFIQRMDNLLDTRIADEAEQIREQAEKDKAELPKLESEIAKPFERKADLEEKVKAHRAVVEKLRAQGGAIELTPAMRAELRDTLSQRGIEQTAL
ncbi:MAG TPA: DEAD/DEAH box helicase family protein, partial [Burkholderiales bacterium]|nr:DEAD/DEAH box helicase family protein [Burkholderiales bacterium]